jgi:hypothetical protein
MAKSRPDRCWPDQNDDLTTELAREEMNLAGRASLNQYPQSIKHPDRGRAFPAANGLSGCWWLNTVAPQIAQQQGSLAPSSISHSLAAVSWLCCHCGGVTRLPICHHMSIDRKFADPARHIMPMDCRHALIYSPKMSMRGRHMTNMKISLLLAALSLSGLTACTETVSQQPTAKMQDQNGAPGPALTGFFGDNAPLLKPGTSDEAALRYINPNANWPHYTKIMLEPVQFWDAANTEVSQSDQHMLTAYMYNKFAEELGKNYTLVDEGGPDVMVVQTALVNATSATPGLRSISVVVPQARVLNGLQSAVTDSYVFVGSAEAMFRIYDAQTGQLLAAAADQRAGGMSVTTAAQWQWGDAENAMNLWAERANERLMKLQGRTQ